MDGDPPPPHSYPSPVLQGSPCPRPIDFPTRFEQLVRENAEKDRIIAEMRGEFSRSLAALRRAGALDAFAEAERLRKASA